MALGGGDHLIYAHNNFRGFFPESALISSRRGPVLLFTRAEGVARVRRDHADAAASAFERRTRTATRRRRPGCRRSPVRGFGLRGLAPLGRARRWLVASRRRGVAAGHCEGRSVAWRPACWVRVRITTPEFSAVRLVSSCSHPCASPASLGSARVGPGKGCGYG